MQNSPRRIIPRPSLDRSDVPDIPQHFKNLVDFIDLDTPFYSGTLAARPAFNAAGHGAGEWYWATDVTNLYFNTGAAWIKIVNDAATNWPAVTQLFNGSVSYTAPVGSSTLEVEGVGAGGGGSGVVAAAAQCSPGGGGGSGAWSYKRVGSNIGTHTVAIGAGGTAGPTGGGAGLAGGDTTFADTTSTVVMKAPGGGGSSSLGSGTTRFINYNENNGAALGSCIGDLFVQGAQGECGRIDSSNGYSRGGDAPRGGNGGFVAANNGGVNGAAGNKFGSAGAGGVGVNSSSNPGGSGANGCLTVKAYG